MLGSFNTPASSNVTFLIEPFLADRLYRWNRGVTESQDVVLVLAESSSPLTSRMDCPEEPAV